MSFYLPGNKVIDSTTLGVTSSPSTSAILAELTAENFESTKPNRQYVVNAWLGGSTAGAWVLELATSSNVDSTSILNQVVLYTAAGQTSQFVKRFTVNGHQRIRARHFSSNTGSYGAVLQAEEIA